MANRIANHMAEIAEMLGVELDEVFLFKGCSSCYTYHSKTYFKFTKSGLKESVNRTSWHSARAWMWKGLITGALQAIKLPWEPSCGEVFYMPSVINENKYIRLLWHDSGTYKSFYQQGMICRTKEEAIKLAEEMLDVARKRFAGDIR